MSIDGWMQKEIVICKCIYIHTQIYVCIVYIYNMCTYMCILYTYIIEYYPAIAWMKSHYLQQHLLIEVSQKKTSTVYQSPLYVESVNKQINTKLIENRTDCWLPEVGGWVGEMGYPFLWFK